MYIPQYFKNEFINFWIWLRLPPEDEKKSYDPRYYYSRENMEIMNLKSFFEDQDENKRYTRSDPIFNALAFYTPQCSGAENFTKLYQEIYFRGLSPYHKPDLTQSTVNSIKKSLESIFQENNENLKMILENEQNKHKESETLIDKYTDFLSFYNFEKLEWEISITQKKDEEKKFREKYNILPEIDICNEKFASELKNEFDEKVVPILDESMKQLISNNYSELNKRSFALFLQFRKDHKKL